MPVNSVGVIDLGSNTFHIVIFEKSQNGTITERFRKRHHVFLSKGGVDEILPESLARAKKAINDFRDILNEIPVHSLSIIGTAALRKASNGADLKTYIETTLASPVQIISGKREAELIAKGVLWELPEKAHNGMIMDIGGGSVEFIHLKEGKIQWLQSFPLGVGVLYSRFPHEEPISKKTIHAIHHYIATEAKELLNYIEHKEIDHLIGCSGSFEIIVSIQEGQYPAQGSYEAISLEDFHRIKDLLFNANLMERKEIKGLPPVRAELIVVAFILMDFIMSTLRIKDISISKYAVKEGVAAEILL